jgi:hypothetical protein
MAGLVVGRTLKPERMAGPGVILVVDDQHIVSEMAQDKWATSWRRVKRTLSSRCPLPETPITGTLSSISEQPSSLLAAGKGFGEHEPDADCGEPRGKLRESIDVGEVVHSGEQTVTLTDSSPGVSEGLMIMRASNANSAGSPERVEGSGSRSRLFNTARMRQMMPHEHPHK